MTSIVLYGIQFVYNTDVLASSYGMDEYLHNIVLHGCNYLFML